MSNKIDEVIELLKYHKKEGSVLVSFSEKYGIDNLPEENGWKVSRFNGNDQIIINFKTK